MFERFPLLVTFFTSLLIILGFFIPRAPFGDIQQTLLVWVLIISGFAALLGVDSLLRLHIKRVTSRGEGWAYSLVLILTFVFIFGLGVFSGIKYGTAFSLASPFMYAYTYGIIPLQATMFSLLAFFITSAAYRAFKARSIDATFLLVAAALVIIGRVPIGGMVWAKLPVIADWILDWPSMAARRGVLLGITLGAIGTSLRIMVGIERSYLR
ncbi:hypothetical protein CH333_01060 [candidate division WOR-3 bacterium JGI_Cruoil_03_44_89]|uniref:Uncharacterized protein n=1 Tax=candidate division WOR-3 bacterium JGI_Cruoil_03_44_89 TaxID=1973748 RepID=A0A235C0P9_UNCW3|nr:MAG: hypothetical protein CH333_01060 [candidate division WOR-3 bacterium JGI_Cruoil_03_44_89]